MNDEPIVRKAVPADAIVLKDFAINCFYNAFAHYNTRENLKQYIEEAFSSEKILRSLNDKYSEAHIAFINGRIAGYIKTNEAPAQTDLNDPASLELERIYIAGDLQGMGLGELLLKKAIAIACEKSKTYIWLGVWEKNINAIRFYTKNGFAQFSSHVFMLGNDAQTDILMKRILA